MSKPLIAVSFALTFAACTSTTGPGVPDPDIEVRRSTTRPVRGTAFSCTRHPAEVLTPCDEFSRVVTGTRVHMDDDQTVAIGLGRSSNVVDGGEVVAWIRLQFVSDGELRATAEQTTIFEWSGKAQDPLAGWVEPVEKSPTTEGRNAGRFSLTFDWGTISGTYDTDDELRTVQ